MSDKEVEDQPTDPFAIFSDKVRENVIGLTHIGYLERPITFCGHSFIIKTLKPGEKAAVAVAAKPWRETLAEAETYANAHIGLALVSVDGDDSFCPPAGPDVDAYARARLQYVTGPEGWYQPTLDFLFDFYLSLEAEAYEAMKEFQDLVTRSQQPLQPSADSSTDSGTLTDATIGESQTSESSS